MKKLKIFKIHFLKIFTHISEFRRAKSMSMRGELYITLTWCVISKKLQKKREQKNNNITCNISHNLSLHNETQIKSVLYD